MKGYANAELAGRAQNAKLSRRDLSPALAPRRPLILDLRPPEAYTAGHVPGAIHLDLWGVSLIDTDPAPLKAFMWMIEHVLAAHGVDAATPVVVYDEQSGMRAARAFWFLEYLGHPSVRLLDGGFGAWTAAASRHPRRRRRRRKANGPATARRTRSRPGAKCRRPSAQRRGDSRYPQ